MSFDLKKLMKHKFDQGYERMKVFNSIMYNKIKSNLHYNITFMRDK